MQGKALAIIGVTLILAILFLITGAWLVGQAGERVVTAITAGLNVVIIAGGIILVSAAIVYAVCAVYQVRYTRAEVREQEAKAERAKRDSRFDVIIADPTDQVYIQDRDHTANWRAAHQDPRVYANGVWSDPQPIETASYLARLEALQPRLATGAPEQLLAPPAQADLLTMLDAFERMLIVGGSGAGKTTLLQHIVGRRSGDLVIVDPHNDNATWPGHAQVLGSAQNYEECETAIIQVVEEIQSRYRERFEQGKQPDEFEPLTLLIDEWRELVQFGSKSMLDGMKKTLTAGRKVSACIILAGHSERVDALGIKGEGDLKDGFAVMRLKGGKGLPFSATLDTGEGEQPVLLPGPYHPGRPALSGQSESRWVVNPDRAMPMSPQEQKILDLWDSGDQAVTRIGRQVYGSKGGWQNDEVRACLAKYGRI